MPYHLSQLMSLWHLSPSVNSIFKGACAAIHWGYTSDFRSNPSSTAILYVCEQRRLWRDCADAQSIRTVSHEPLLFAYAISTIISWAGLFHHNQGMTMQDPTPPRLRGQFLAQNNVDVLLIWTQSNTFGMSWVGGLGKIIRNTLQDLQTAMTQERQALPNER